MKYCEKRNSYHTNRKTFCFVVILIRTCVSLITMTVFTNIVKQRGFVCSCKVLSVKSGEACVVLNDVHRRPWAVTRISPAFTIYSLFLNTLYFTKCDEIAKSVPQSAWRTLALPIAKFKYFGSRSNVSTKLNKSLVWQVISWGAVWDTKVSMCKVDQGVLT